jgi:hypothetical protein
MDTKLTMLSLIVGAIISLSDHGGENLFGRARRFAVLHLRARRKTRDQ